MVFILFTEVDPVQNGWCRSTCLLRKDTQIIPMARHMPCQDSLPSAYMKVLDTLLVRTFVYDVFWHRGIKESGVKLTSPASNRISLLGFCMWLCWRHGYYVHCPISASSSESLIHIEDAYIGILRSRKCPGTQLISNEGFLLVGHFEPYVDFCFVCLSLFCFWI